MIQTSLAESAATASRFTGAAPPGAGTANGDQAVPFHCTATVLPTAYAAVGLMSATLRSSEPLDGTTDHDVPFQCAASADVWWSLDVRPTSQASDALLALAAYGTVLMAPLTVGPVTCDQAVPFQRATSGVVRDPMATAQASLSVRADTAAQIAADGGGAGTTVQVTAAPAGAAASTTAAAAAARPAIKP